MREPPPELVVRTLRRTLPEGEGVAADGRRGVVDPLGPIAPTFRDGIRKWSIPNRRRMDEVIG